MKRIFATLMIPLLISCELIVDIEVPFEEKQVTANSFFNPDSLWSVHLNLNRNILDEVPFQEINDAHVVIFEEGSPIDTLANMGYGRFRSENERPEPGRTYTLSAKAPGYKDLHASSFVPFPSPITNIDVYELSSNQNTMVKVKFRDDGVETNFYELYVEWEIEYYNSEKKQVESRLTRLQLISDDPAIQNDNDSYSNSIVFEDVRFNGREVELTFRMSGGGISYHGTTTVTLRTISEDGYNYLRTALLQDMTSGDPFAQPVNVYNNIQNGFGIFAGYSASAYTKANPKPAILNVDPPTGKPGDHIIITGENFIVLPERHATVAFQGIQNPISAQIVQLTPTHMEVIVPSMAVTGKILVQNGRIAASDADFVVTD